LGQVIGQREALTPAPNVGVRKQHKAALVATAVFRTPQAALVAAEAVIVCYVQLVRKLLFLILFIF